MATETPHARPTLSDRQKRDDILAKQKEISPWMTFMPLSCICPHCGFDFVDFEPAYKELITGCPNVGCFRSYCE